MQNRLQKHVGEKHVFLYRLEVKNIEHMSGVYLVEQQDIGEEKEWMRQAKKAVKKGNADHGLIYNHSQLAERALHSSFSCLFPEDISEFF